MSLFTPKAATNNIRLVFVYGKLAKRDKSSVVEFHTTVWEIETTGWEIWEKRKKFETQKQSNRRKIRLFSQATTTYINYAVFLS